MGGEGEDRVRVPIVYVRKRGRLTWVIMVRFRHVMVRIGQARTGCD